MINSDKILTYIGFAASKRKAVTGTELVLNEVRKGKKNICVIEASDVSDRTDKQLSDKCAYYKVPKIKLEKDMYELGKRLGKTHPTAAIAVTDEGLVKEILKNI